MTWDCHFWHLFSARVIRSSGAGGGASETAVRWQWESARGIVLFLVTLDVLLSLKYLKWVPLWTVVKYRLERVEWLSSPPSVPYRGRISLLVHMRDCLLMFPTVCESSIASWRSCDPDVLLTWCRGVGGKHKVLFTEHGCHGKPVVIFRCVSVCLCVCACPRAHLCEGLEGRQNHSPNRNGPAKTRLAASFTCRLPINDRSPRNSEWPWVLWFGIAVYPIIVNMV